MRVAVMLRTIDQRRGTGIDARDIVAELPRTEPENESLLPYRTDRHLGRRGGFPDAIERLLRAASKALRDPRAVPRATGLRRVGASSRGRCARKTLAVLREAAR